MKKYILFGILAVVMLLSGCTEQVQEIPELLVPVGASLDRTTVQLGDMEDVSIYTAAVAPRHTTLYFTADTVIGQVLAPLGSEVKAGDTIVTMDVSSVQRAISSLDAEADSLNAEADTAKQLYDIDMELYSLYMEKAATEDERYDIETEMQLYDMEYANTAATRDERLAAIAAERASLEAQLGGASLVAPSDGHVVYMGYSAGQTAGAYDAVCVVTDINSPTLQSTYVPASVLNDAVEIYALVGGERYPLEAEPVDEADYTSSILRGGEYLSVFTAPEGTPLTIGDSAAVCVVTMRKTNVLKLPVNAVFEEDGEYYVYIVEGETRTRRPVSVGAKNAVEYELISGVEEGEVVYVGD